MSKNDWHHGLAQTMVGGLYGRLTVLSVYKQGSVWYGACECSCGTRKSIRLESLLNGRTKSCGCYNKELVSKRTSKGNFSNTRLYHVWENMKSRCNNSHNPEFHNYGGRGIKVCALWNNFLEFRKWALLAGYDSTAPKNVCTIDRIDNDGNYEPSNCRWVTCKENQNNKRKTRRFEYNGSLYSLRELSILANIRIEAMRSRIYTQKLTVKEAVEKPVHPRKGKSTSYTQNVELDEKAHQC